MLKKSFLQAFLKKWRKLSAEVVAHAGHEYSGWNRLGGESSFAEGDQETKATATAATTAIPKDVPKGHMVVYVGEERRRFVIKVAFLEHPLFQALLDRAREEYDFSPDAKLCIPCEETVFVSILCSVSSVYNKRIWLCN